MAIYRTIQLSFWTDEKVLDDFTPEDKYFYLYLFTNPQTNLCGCYELGWTNTTSQIGYNKDSVLRLLDRFENVHHVIKYSKETKEVLILNWHKYNWQGGNQIPCIRKEIESVKDLELKSILAEIFNKKFDTDKPLTSPLQANCLQATVTVNNNIYNTNSIIKDKEKDKYKDSINNIISYLNSKLNTKYRPTSKIAVKHITARLNEGYLEEDFFTVIDNMVAIWGSDAKMSQYLTPDTLFGTKFEKYLNMTPSTPKTDFDEWGMMLEAERGKNNV